MKDYNITFGSFIKELRKDRGYGLREFARKLGLNPSNLSHIETGHINPPRSEETLRNIAVLLDLKEGEEKWNTLFDLSTQGRNDLIPPDIIEYSKKTEVIPILLRTVANKKLTREQLEQLAEEINKKF